MLRVENLNKQVVLVEKGRVANNIATRFVGLMGVRHLPAGEGMAIMPCHGVHCMFMSIPIDVLYMSKDHRVVAMDPNLKPWRFGGMYRGVHYVLELPAGVIAQTSTAVGDQLRVTF
jgi:uncharacterized membrane protein (UPF0127 family)